MAAGIQEYKDTLHLQHFNRVQQTKRALSLEIEPGDAVQVHDAPTSVPYGERLTVRRTATVTRAGPLERAWTKLIAHLELTELYEVSFSERRKL